MHDKDRDEQTAPGEAVEDTMPELEDLPGDAQDRDGKRSAPRSNTSTTAPENPGD